MSKSVKAMLKKAQEERKTEFDFGEAKEKAIESEKNFSTKKAEEVNVTSQSSSTHIYSILTEQLIPAPKKWNIYSNIHDDPERFADMITSISRNGLLEPIIVWEQKEPNTYMILAGHSRVEIYKYLYEEFGEEAEIFSRIPARVYQYKELTEARAHEIVIDTNEVSRKEFSTIERVRAIAAKHRLIRTNRDYYFEQGITGKTRDIVGDQMNISPREVSYMVALDKMPDHMLSLADDRVVPFSFLKKISNSPSEIWDYVYKKRKELTPAIMRSIKSTSDLDEVKGILSDSVDEHYDVIQITLPEDKSKDYIDEIKDLLGEAWYKIDIKKKRS